MQIDYLQHRSQVVLGQRFRHAACPCIAIAREWPRGPRQPCALLICFAGHDGGDRAAESAPFSAIVTVSVTHDERAEIRVTEPERADNVRVLRDLFDRITR